MNKYHQNLFYVDYGHLWKPYYQEPHRHYHTEKHIYDMVLAAEEHDIELTLPQAIAVMFHDAVYIPGNECNEVLSAELINYLFQDQLDSIEDFQDCLWKAKQIILSTAEHKPLCESAKLVIDLDLIGLATNYEENSDLVEAEFCLPNRDDWFFGRSKWIKSMLAKEQLFYTDQFKQYENVARKNLKIELTKLSGML